MKFFNLSMVTVGVVLAANVCAQTNIAHVFRLSFSEQKVTDTVEFHAARTNLTSRKETLNYLTNAPTRLAERDVVIMNIQHHGAMNEPGTEFRWSLAAICKATGAELFDFDCGGVTTNRGLAIREMCVLHWKSPYLEPRNLQKTDFYLDESFTGNGESGLRKAVKLAIEKKPGYLAMAGSRYTHYSSYGPDESPFEDSEKEIESLLASNSIARVRLCADYVWAANGEES